MISELFQVDAFTDERFSGNPAAVCALDTDGFPDAALMQSVALEMNLSETAFLTRAVDGARPLRWFTPTVEVELCGHATLASAHVLWEQGLATGDVLTFSTRSGNLSARRRDSRLIAIDLPADRPQPCDAPDGLAQALGCTAEEVVAGAGYLVVRLESPAAVEAVRPDMSALAALGPRGVTVTAPAGEADRADFVSRVFVPAAGVPEDPVTGSAHCVLTPFWSARLGRRDLTAYQASERGGWLEVSDRGDRVELAGAAVTVARVVMI